MNVAQANNPSSSKSAPTGTPPEAAAGGQTATNANDAGATGHYVNPANAFNTKDTAPATNPAGSNPNAGTTNVELPKYNPRPTQDPKDCVHSLHVSVIRPDVRECISCGWVEEGVKDGDKQTPQPAAKERTTNGSKIGDYGTGNDEQDAKVAKDLANEKDTTASEQTKADRGADDDDNSTKARAKAKDTDTKSTRHGKSRH